jgi:hypothetical protein
MFLSHFSTTRSASNTSTLFLLSRPSSRRRSVVGLSAPVLVSNESGMEGNGGKKLLRNEEEAEQLVMQK